MALTNWNDILNKPNGIDEVPEIALTVEQLSASVLSISEDVGEIALDVSQLSATVLSIAGDVDDLMNPEGLTIEETENDYVTDLTHCRAIKNGPEYKFIFEFSIVAASVTSNWVKIGTISGWHPSSTTNAYCQTIGQAGIYTMATIRVSNIGDIFVYVPVTFSSTIFRGSLSTY